MLLELGGLADVPFGPFPFGMVIRGIRDNERRTAAIGFPPYPYKLVAFVIAGGIAGLAGA